MKKMTLICALVAFVCVSCVRAPLDVRASRTFAGPTEFPPSGFSGYGILVFEVSPERDPERFQMFCLAYLDTLVDSERLTELGISPSEQMVTVMPVVSKFQAEQIASLPREAACEQAATVYDRVQAQDAIAKARAAEELTDGLSHLDGRGPFLLAWVPGSEFGNQNTLVLAADLSNTSTPEQALSDMRTWVRDIQEDPQLWRQGWNIEGVRLIAQRWLDRRGVSLLKFLGELG